MAEMRVAASTRVIARNSMGRFIADCEQAAQDTVSEIVKEGADKSRDFAPEKTGALKKSITPVVVSRTQGHWFSDLPYALPQETGSVPHPIVGSPDLAFYWEKYGRDFIPARFLYQDPDAITVVSHPGNPATHFLQRGYDAVKRRAISIAKKHYPG